MPRYRVFHLRDELSRRFQELPAASVRKQLKPKDYTPVAELEAANEYAAWQALRAADLATATGEKPGRPFAVGDVLEPEEGKPLLCLFGGFEEAAWWTAEPAATANAEDSTKDGAAGASSTACS